MQLTIFQAEEWAVQNYLCPLPQVSGEGGGGHIVFGADPIGVSVDVSLSCLHNIL